VDEIFKLHSIFGCPRALWCGKGSNKSADVETAIEYTEAGISRLLVERGSGVDSYVDQEKHSPGFQEPEDLPF
jgi:hypothetical protein